MIVAAVDERDVNEFKALIEAAWPQFEEFFGRCVLEVPVELRCFDELAADVRRDGGVTPTADAGGYTVRLNSRVVSYAIKQPSRWYTRALIIHELAHQFYFHAFNQGGASDLPFWFCEGIVERCRCTLGTATICAWALCRFYRSKATLVRCRLSTTLRSD